ncbi:MAG: hypothetical protein JWO58_676 [Chitinophagaceae bacterium]|nr:hypothetical protein [Chitinophagaceae bacterium]
MRNSKRFILVIFVLMNSMSVYGQIAESKMVGYWKHVDMLNKSEINVTIDIKPFDLKLFKDHRFEMIGNRVKVKGTWALEDSTLVLIDPTKGEREFTIQKLHVLKADGKTLEFTVNNFDVTGGLKILLKKIE